MKMRRYNYLESAALYCAERSMGKSSPIFVYKIPQPENLVSMINEMKNKDIK